MDALIQFSKDTDRQEDSSSLVLRHIAEPIEILGDL